MNSRSRWLMKHPVQAKYLLIVLVAVLAPILFLGYCFYHLVFSLLAQQISFPEAIFANLVPVIDRVNAILALGLPVLVLALLVVALAISHRFAGPIERLETELDQVLAGDHTRRIHLRRSDDLSGVADRMNRILDAWNHGR